MEPSRTAPAPVPTSARVVGALMSLVLWALGVHAILTRAWEGQTKAGRPVHLEGRPAMAMGAILCALGILPLLLVVRGPRARAACAWAFAVGFVVALLALLGAPGGR